MEELCLLDEYQRRQDDPEIHELRKQAQLVPWKMYTSTDPEFQHRLDNSKCLCQLCYQFSGTKAKNCWVYEELGCEFSVAVREFFRFNQVGENQFVPYFDLET